MLSSAGINGYFGGRLARAGVDVRFSARGRHLAIVMSRALTGRSKPPCFPEVTPVNVEV